MMASDFVRRRADSAPGNKSRFVFFTVHKPLMTNLRPSRLHFLPKAVFSRDTIVSAKKRPDFKCKFHQILRPFLVPGVATKP